MGRGKRFTFKSKIRVQGPGIESSSQGMIYPDSLVDKNLLFLPLFGTYKVAIHHCHMKRKKGVYRISIYF